MRYLLFLCCLLLCSCSLSDEDKNSLDIVDSLSNEMLARRDSVAEQGFFFPSRETKGTDGNGVVARDSVLDLTISQVDSLVFRLSHHYSENFNFVVKADSLVLVPREGDLLRDTCVVYDGDVIVVARIKTVPVDSVNSDSIWVKVAHDQYTMGWIPEKELLEGVVPDDSISRMLDLLTGSRGLWMSALVLCGVLGFFLRKGKVRKLQILKFDEMDSFYPLLFLSAMALMALVYACVQIFVPEYWQEYYYHPTLNPLQLPALMAGLVTLLWIVIILYLAVIDEIYHNFYFMPGVAYLLELTGLAMVEYLIVSWTTQIYIGYVITPLIFGLGWWRYMRHNAS